MVARVAKILVCLVLCTIVNAQSDVVTPHSVSRVVPAAVSEPVSVNGVSEVARPTSPVSVNGVSEVSTSTGDISLGFAAPPFFSWVTENSEPTSGALPSTSSKSNKGKIAGYVVGGLAVVIAAIGALVFLRLRSRRSTTHWRNRVTGTWQDQEGKAGGPVYVGRPVDRPFDGYYPDFKVPVASPTTSAPVFIREPRLAQPFSVPQRGHTRGSSSSHIRNDSMEMSPTTTRLVFN
ncbi:hypothetical protein MVEN_00539700 [Mycena venus]|uniref:Transmembrane protein n=1 Tax=Mycena venus TaxID=2733690 RepID=A0A8H7D778_9AGAR|nr:hypothetical protein MVEN_00539700 [Mycena venus]